MAGEKLMMQPSEFTGDGWLTGRPVLVRLVDLNALQADKGDASQQEPLGQPAASQPAAKGAKGKGKGKDKCKGKTDGEKLKCEVHLLGGEGMGEVAFVEAFGPAGKELHSKATQAKTEKHLLTISNVKVIRKANQYTTSRLPYYIQLKTAAGSKSIVEIVPPEGAWASVPAHHPFLDIAKIAKVQSDVQHCVLGVVTRQPGAKWQETRYGAKYVCNAILRAGGNTIKCSFWRHHATELAKWTEGTAIALYQVIVKREVTAKGNVSWELRATEATQVAECPAELAQALLASVADNGPATSLTAAIAKDYKTCETSTMSLSALTAVIVPGNARDLDGVYEAHSVAIMGVSAVLRNEGFVMRCCSTCKKQVPDGDHGVCAEHGEALVEPRWIFQLELTDATGHCAAMLYHDVAMQIPGFPDPSTATDTEIQKFLQTLRAVPYSIRLIYRINALREVNNLETKLLLPTLTPDGVVGSWRLDPTPIASSNTACPFAKCTSVGFDPDLGFAIVDGSTVTAVRLLVKFLEPEDDEETTVPDTAQGLRVTRFATCALEPVGQTAPAKYRLTAGGLSSAVQWLVRADGTFFVTATKRKNDDTFVVQSHHKVAAHDTAMWTQYMTKTLAIPKGPPLTFGHTVTPLKRKRALDDAAAASAAADMTVRSRGLVEA